MMVSKDLGWVGGRSSTVDSVLATHRPVIWNMGSGLAQTDVGEMLLAKKHKGTENKDLRIMAGLAGKKGFVREEDRKGGTISWDQVMDKLAALGSKWGVGAGSTRVGDLKGNEVFQKELSSCWKEWEGQTNLWWSEVCDEEKRAGGWLKVGQGCIQDLVKDKKAQEWNCGTAWEWMERRLQEALGTWAKWNPSAGGKGWTARTAGKVGEWAGKLGLDKGLCDNIRRSLEENCYFPTLTSKKFMEHLLEEVREKRKGADRDICKGQNKIWKEKVEKWIDGNSKEAYSLMKMGEKGNVNHSVGLGRIPNILEEVEIAEKVWEGWWKRKEARLYRSV